MIVMKKYIPVIILLVLYSSTTIFAQEEEESPDTIGVGGVNWFAYPFVFFSLE